MGCAAASSRWRSFRPLAFLCGEPIVRSAGASVGRRLDLVQAALYNQAAFEREVVDEESFCREKNNDADLAGGWR